MRPYVLETVSSVDADRERAHNTHHNTLSCTHTLSIACTLSSQWKREATITRTLIHGRNRTAEAREEESGPVSNLASVVISGEIPDQKESKMASLTPQKERDATVWNAMQAGFVSGGLAAIPSSLAGEPAAALS